MTRTSCSRSRDAPFSFFDPHAPIYTHRVSCRARASSTVRSTPPSSATGARSIAARSGRSVVGDRDMVRRGRDHRASGAAGADFYEERTRTVGAGPPLGIGRDVVLDRVIVDKNARIGEGAP